MRWSHVFGKWDWFLDCEHNFRSKTETLKSEGWIQNRHWKLFLCHVSCTVTTISFECQSIVRSLNKRLAASGSQKFLKKKRLSCRNCNLDLKRGKFFFDLFFDLLDPKKLLVKDEKDCRNPKVFLGSRNSYLQGLGSLGSWRLAAQTERVWSLQNERWGVPNFVCMCFQIWDPPG